MAANLQNPVLVPIRIDAIWSDGSATVAPPSVDYSLLAQTRPAAGGNASNAKPWLGDTVRPSLAETRTLQAGVHLHWTLPAALRHGTTVYVVDNASCNELIQQGMPWSLVQQLRAMADKSGLADEIDIDALLQELVSSAPGATPSKDATNGIQNLISGDPNVQVLSNLPYISWDAAYREIYGPMVLRACARMKMPPVPNRWLVVRDGNTAWVVESDRLTGPGDVLGQGVAGPVAIPTKFKAGDKGPDIPGPLYQHLGMKSPAMDWSEPASSELAQVFSPLTAVGHGVPEFATCYPECQGVFGFCDESADANASHTYTVIGWFSDPANDPVSSAYAVMPWAVERDVAARMSKLKWAIKEASGLSSVDGSVFGASIGVTVRDCPISTKQDLSDTTKVSIGNTAAEALAAYLAQSQAGNHSGTGLDTETLLNAVQTGLARRVLEVDGQQVVENALHQAGFQSEAHGWLWDIVNSRPSEPGLSATIPDKGMVLPEAVAHALNVLNRKQFQFDRTQACLNSQRGELFADWCRALHLETDDAGVNAETGKPTALTGNSNNLGNIGNLSGAVVNQQATAIDVAGMAYGDPSQILAYMAAQALYSAISELVAVLPAGLQLKRLPAPRYWRPNDPVVLLTGDDVLPSGDPLTYQTTDGEPHLACSVFPQTQGSSTASPAYISSSWSQGPAGGVVAALVSDTSPLPRLTAGRSWRPLLLQWEAQFFPFQGSGGLNTSGTTAPYPFQDYAPDFLANNFSFDPAGVELVANSGAGTQAGYATYNGRVVLSSHATGMLQDRIRDLVGSTDEDKLDITKLPGTLATEGSAQMLKQAYDANAQTLSQTLAGFNDRLLMLRRIPQPGVFDPNYNTETASWHKSATYSPDYTWDSDSQSFYVEIGLQKTASPLQTDLYNPIRAGRCELTSLSIVDAFGQVRTWSQTVSNTTIASSLPNLTEKAGDAAPAFLLPPRFAQASRLLFRWLAADGSGDVESNRHPATTPICGWVALNRVDSTILFYNADGTLIGWVPAGGGDLVQAFDASSVQPDDPFLQQVISESQIANSSLFDDIDDALLTIEPRSHRHHTARCVLISRPLALVRASLRLELLGMPAPHQGYEWLAAAQGVATTGKLNTDTFCPVEGGVSPFLARETCGFTKVKVPVRLGNVSMDDDGLVAYWPLAQAGSAWTLGNRQMAASESPVHLFSEPGSPATQILMLIDPRAPVHATSGVLPTKAISVPPDYYTGAMRNMELFLRVEPVLTAVNQAAFPIPTEVHLPWHWLADQSSTAVDVSKVDDRFHLAGTPPVLRQGWLRANKIVENSGEK